MKIIGLNFGHDSALTYIEDGAIRFSIEEEKTSRVKQDFGWAQTAWGHVSGRLGLKPEDIDIVSVGGLYYNAIAANEIRYRFTKKDRYKNREIVDRITAYLNITQKKISERNIDVFREELRKLGFTKAKLVFEGHHRCHAAGGFYNAPFQPDLVITCDGFGDEDSFVFYGSDAQEGLKQLHRIAYDASIGQFYSCITQLLGFRPTRHEGKITGLAAYGKNGPLVKFFSDLFFYEGDDLRRFPYGQVEEMNKKYRVEDSISLKERVNLKTSESDVGYRYGLNARILLAWLKEMTAGHSKEDIAFACQQVTEQVVVRECGRIYEKHFNGEQLGVGLAGGVFANVRVNQMIFELPWVKNIFVQPAMGDSGLAIGAAMLTEIRESKRDPLTRDYAFKDTYWGPNYEDELDEFIKTLDASKFVSERMEQPAKRVAQIMADNGIVGFWQGAMEWGPRALGQRSIILNTFNREVNQTLNDRLNRTEFMPFAPSVVDYKAVEYFPAYDAGVPAGDYMTITYDVKEEHRDLLQAVTHVDGTARPQVVTRESNPYYYDIISEFERLTGCGAIVNTSFNAHEEPIVSSPAVALGALATNRVDYLVLGEYLVSRK
jgi:carbamoyltransferase